MKKKITLGLITLVSVVIALTGCNKGNTEVKEATQKVKLTMGSWRPEDKDIYEKIIKAFNKNHPDIEIQFSPTKNTEYATVLNTALQTGGGPDLIQLRPYGVGQTLSDAGYLEPLDGLKGLDVFPKDALLATTGSNGKVYGVPMVYSTTLVFYNKQIFKKYNLQEPKTWDEFIKVAETLKQNKVVPFAFGAKESFILSLTHGALGPALYGGNEFVQKLLTGQTNFKSKEFMDSIQMMKDLTPYFPANFAGMGQDDMRNMFASEQAAMEIMGSFDLAPTKQANPSLDFDVFPIPDKSGKQSVTTWVDGSYAINAKSPNKVAARKFLEFMTTKEFGTIVSDEMMKPTTVPGVESKEPLVSKITKYSNSIATPYTFVVYFAFGNPTSKATLENALQGMYLNKLSPQQVTEEVQKSVDSWFKPKK
ncbi:ABC transporter substrate-binding protein [Paenibacillus sp. LjRoot56]|uniref:ABC transporter substrate-binding protein n=1 Tax=Paenibacillus sp. LjRoot56 TaxID=3342333 RepID=UPI003ED06CF3